ncbi:MAG: ABC transporter ATP-binding protein [Lewinellaceae bacterium]|nr:ABC transporter ATP-binding protein [Lewinellaceae bacterium]
MFLDVQHITKTFEGDTVLSEVSFGLEKGRTLAILGRSGCGKTTLLKIMAGLLEGQGRVELDGRDISALPPRLRGVVYLYQEPLLFPHLNAFENVAFGLRLQRLPEPEIRRRVEAMLEALELAEHAKKMPPALSGGQKQRVSFGRALIVQPQLLLLDEPFGALDVETRASMQQLFKRIAGEQGITSIFVTHDLKEAVLTGDRLAYMERGRLHIFDNLSDFTADPRTGMGQEIEFWKKISR